MLEAALWLAIALSWLGVLVIFGITGFAVACVLGVIVHVGRELVRGLK